MRGIMFGIIGVTRGGVAPTSGQILLTLDSTPISSDQTDFPLQIILDGSASALYAAVFSALGSNYKKISIVSGVTELPVEVDYWDNANQYAVLTTKVPTYTHASDATLTLSYDAEMADNDTYVGLVGTTPGNNVYDSSFLLEQHMSQDPSAGGACVLDSTSNALAGTPIGTTSWLTEHLVDAAHSKGLQFAATRKITEPGLDTLFSGGLAPFTIEAVVKGINSGGCLVNIAGGGAAWDTTSGSCVVIYHHPSYNVLYCYYNKSGTGTGLSTGVTPVAATEYHVSIKWDGSNIVLVLDGVVKGSGTGLTLPTNRYMAIGNMYLDYTQGLTGIYSTFAVSSIARSTDWLLLRAKSFANLLVTPSSL